MYGLVEADINGFGVELFHSTLYDALDCGDISGKWGRGLRMTKVNETVMDGNIYIYVYVENTII